MNKIFALEQAPFEMYPLPEAGLPFVPFKEIAALNFVMPEAHSDRRRKQPSPRKQTIGKIIIVPVDENSPIYGEIPIYYDGDDPDLFLGGLIKNVSRSVGRAVESAVHTVGDLSSSLADTLGKVPIIGSGLKGLYGYTYGALIQSADNVVSGVRLDKVLSRHLESQIKNIKEIAPYVQTIVSVVPGIGPGISGAISAGLTLAQGRPIDEALVDAAAGALPGGALAKSMAKMAFAVSTGKPLSDIAVSALPISPAAKDGLKAGLRIASDVAQGKRVDKSLLAEANREIDRLPPELRKAAQVGVALGQGKKLQDIAVEQLPRLITVGGPLAAVGQKIASKSPVVRQARGLVPRGQHGFDVAQGLMAHSGVPRHQIEQARRAFKGDNLKGFDTAMALHKRPVLSPPRTIKMGTRAK